MIILFKDWWDSIKLTGKLIWLNRIWYFNYRIGDITMENKFSNCLSQKLSGKKRLLWWSSLRFAVHWQIIAFQAGTAQRDYLFLPWGIEHLDKFKQCLSYFMLYSFIISFHYKTLGCLFCQNISRYDIEFAYLLWF